MSYRHPNRTAAGQVGLILVKRTVVTSAELLIMSANILHRAGGGGAGSAELSRSDFLDSIM